MISLRMHYIMNGKARCGNTTARNWTFLPQAVTCETCKKLMKKDIR